MIKVDIQKNVYYDSVSLMLITRDVKAIEGINDANICMATEHNKELLNNVGLLTEDGKKSGPNDLITAFNGSEEAIEQAKLLIKDNMNKKTKFQGGEVKYTSIKKAAAEKEDTNFVVISVPGEYAAMEAETALNLNKHVMLFSDNVSLEEEIRLKKLATKKQLLMMGPDCGTAIINGKPLGFANKVNTGHIGIVGASGTGIQEVSTIIDKLGLGISQAIGTGGRDLTKDVNGLMMEAGIDALSEDENTSIIVLISKPPHPDVASKIIEKAKKINKPFVINFLGETRAQTGNIYFCSTLEETALKACTLAKTDIDFNKMPHSVLETLNSEFRERQKYLRALYTGGTLCDESMLIAKNKIKDIYSNTPVKGCKTLENPFVSQKNTFVDLGDDVFTKGKPHPMIEPDGRNQRILEEAKDPETAVILLDFVIGYGAHEDPVGACIPFIDQALVMNPSLCFIASVTGTDKDPQGLEKQTKLLEENEVILTPCNAQAARLAVSIIKELS